MKPLVCAALYTGTVHYAYVSYISPTFEYAHYTYNPPAPMSLVITYVLACLVVLAYKNTRHVAQSAAVLIYGLCYVPIQLSILFSVERSYAEIFPVQLALGISMIAIFLCARLGPESAKDTRNELKVLDRLLVIVGLCVIVAIVIMNHDHMRIVSFEDVYDLRMDATETQQGVVLDYLSSWLSYCFISYFFARALIHKKWMYMGFGIAGSLVQYMATGAKASLLLLLMTAGLVALWRDGKGFLIRTLASLVALLLFLIVLLPDEGLAVWAKSLVMVRVIGTSGWTASKYLEYFGANVHTYYSHIGIVNAIFGGYPYGQYSLGQVIGIEYSGSVEANFNASFWASDGFAALGTAGIYVVTVPVGLLLYVINRVTVRFEGRFTVAWMTGFLVALLNVPLTTALVSGGGALILLLAGLATRPSRGHDESLSMVAQPQVITPS